MKSAITDIMGAYYSPIYIRTEIANRLESCKWPFQKIGSNSTVVIQQLGIVIQHLNSNSTVEV